jgi:hypothetical protein
MEFNSLEYYQQRDINILALQERVKFSKVDGEIINITSRDCANKMLANTILNENGCWDFQGGKDGVGGYGKVSIGHSYEVRTHRLSYYLFYQRNPGNMHIMHSCNRPICINPSHISGGTHQENMAYMWDNNRVPNKRKFSNKEVVEIVKRYNELRDYLAVAKEFNCSDFCIRNIILSPTRTKEAGLDSKEYLTNDPRNTNLKEIIKMDANVPIKSMGGNSKLTWDIVNQIRKDYETIKSPVELSRIHNVCRKTISKIVRNKSWVVNEETLKEQREFTKEEIQLMKDRYVVVKSYPKVAKELGIGINRTRNLIKSSEFLVMASIVVDAVPI